MRGLFVTGTGTGVGKTVLSAALLAAMRATGVRVTAHKPVVTGLCEPPGQWPADHELLATAAGTSAASVTRHRYQSASAPHLAAALEGAQLTREMLLRDALAVARGGDGGGGDDGRDGGRDGGRDDGDVVAVIEGIGGLMVPLTDDFCVRDLAVELGLPLLIAASSELGTINHTLLTLQSARAAGLDVRAVVLTPWPEQPSPLALSNLETIERLGAVEVQRLPTIAEPDVSLLAQAGKRLPWSDWV